MELGFTVKYLEGILIRRNFNWFDEYTDSGTVELPSTIDMLFWLKGHVDRWRQKFFDYTTS